MQLPVHRGSKALVHWWYAPDSYDGLISADTAPEEAEPDRRVRGAWPLLCSLVPFELALQASKMMM